MELSRLELTFCIDLWQVTALMLVDHLSTPSILSKSLSIVTFMIDIKDL